MWHSTLYREYSPPYMSPVLKAILRWSSCWFIIMQPSTSRLMWVMHYTIALVSVYFLCIVDWVPSLLSVIHIFTIIMFTTGWVCRYSTDCCFWWKSNWGGKNPNWTWGKLIIRIRFLISSLFSNLLIISQYCIPPHDRVETQLFKLHACVLGNTDIVKLLIQSNANIELKNKVGLS